LVVEVEVEVDEERDWDEVLLKVSAWLAAELGVRGGSGGVSILVGSISKTEYSIWSMVECFFLLVLDFRWAMAGCCLASGGAGCK